MKGKTLSEREYLASGVYQMMHPSLGKGTKLDVSGIEAAKARLLSEIRKCNEELTSIEAEEQSLIARRAEILAEMRNTG